MDPRPHENPTGTPLPTVPIVDKPGPVQAVPTPGATTPARAAGAEAAPASAGAAEGASVSLSPTLAGLRPGDEITGLIAAATDTAKPALRTQGGTFSVDTKATLPPGALVDVRVVAVGATVRAMITTIGATPQAPPVAAELALASLGDGTKTSSHRWRYLFDAHRHGDTAADRGHRIGSSNHRGCRIHRAIGTDGDPDVGWSRGGGNARPPATGNGGNH